MTNYLWKKLSESERNHLEGEAKELILAFGDELEKLPAMKESFVEREKDLREEKGEGETCDDSFRELMFENAPKKKGGFIVAEKGGWVNG